MLLTNLHAVGAFLDENLKAKWMDFRFFTSALNAAVITCTRLIISNHLISFAPGAGAAAARCRLPAPRAQRRTRSRKWQDFNISFESYYY